MGNCDHRKPPPCFFCLKVVSWIPVLFISSVIVWSYYAYVVQLCFLSVENTFERIVFLIFYHLICVLFFWSYAQTIFTPVATVPMNWRIPDSDIERVFRCDNLEQQKRLLEQLAKEFPVTNRTINGSFRFCEKCKVIKPDRAHHCSVCRACVLKMDHHCPWVNNCVNFKNYKFFVLFLGYALLYCIYIAVTSLEYFIRFWRGELNSGSGRFHILFLFFVSLMFAISLVSLFGYHVYLVLMNRTTLEAFRAPIFRVGGADKNGFNLGKFANFQEVFGDNWKLWLLPVYTSLGDGVIYPMATSIQLATYDSMGDTLAGPRPIPNIPPGAGSGTGPSHRPTDNYSTQKLFSANGMTPAATTPLKEAHHRMSGIPESPYASSLSRDDSNSSDRYIRGGTDIQDISSQDIIINIDNGFSEPVIGGQTSPGSNSSRPLSVHNRVHPKVENIGVGTSLQDIPSTATQLNIEVP